MYSLLEAPLQPKLSSETAKYNVVQNVFKIYPKSLAGSAASFKMREHLLKETFVYPTLIYNENPWQTLYSWLTNFKYFILSVRYVYVKGGANSNGVCKFDFSGMHVKLYFSLKSLYVYSS